jgi:small subunit ribosomal protein S2
LIDRKIEKLQKMFWGIKDMSALPKAIFIVDPRYEQTALKEAKSLNIPVVALCGSDNNIAEINYPISANDSNMASIRFFTEAVAEAYRSIDHYLREKETKINQKSNNDNVANRLANIAEV